MLTTKIDDKDVHIDPTTLFSRLTAVANLEENVVDNFSYELTPEATSLFKHGLIRKPNKATSRKHFATKESLCCWCWGITSQSQVAKSNLCWSTWSLWKLYEQKIFKVCECDGCLWWIFCWAYESAGTCSPFRFIISWYTN